MQINSSYIYQEVSEEFPFAATCFEIKKKDQKSVIFSNQ